MPGPYFSVLLAPRYTSKGADRWKTSPQTLHLLVEFMLLERWGGTRSLRADGEWGGKGFAVWRMWLWSLGLPLTLVWSGHVPGPL